MYFVILALLGFFIGKLMRRNKGVALIVVISVLWGISSAPIWGLASLGEMFLGFYIAQIAKK
jgi:hypothetical protein